jgi:hypothetical protein
MNHEWAARERRTNRLVRAIAQHIFARGLEGDDLFHLSRLTWITKSHTGDKSSYVRSLKLPALRHLFRSNYPTLEEAADAIARDLRRPEMRDLVLLHTGITNIYNAYRNSSSTWMNAHKERIESLFRAAYAADTDADRVSLSDHFRDLPLIPAPPGKRKGALHSEYLLTPVCFALDRDIRFPILNGQQTVRKLLKLSNVHGADLGSQIRAMINWIGSDEISDAADLDCLEGSSVPREPRKQGHELKSKSTLGRDLPLKDENDVEVIRAALTETRRRRHNELTNELKNRLDGKYRLTEGNRPSALFDACIANYNGASESLLVEVKSSIEDADIRMAIGQLHAYWFAEMGDQKPHIAVLLPSKPNRQAVNLLHWCNVGLLWFAADGLHTTTHWLAHLTESGVAEI